MAPRWLARLQEPQLGGVPGDSINFALQRQVRGPPAALLLGPAYALRAAHAAQRIEHCAATRRSCYLVALKEDRSYGKLAPFG